MRKILAVGLLALPLSGCLQNDIQRGLVGAGAGTALTYVTGGNLAAGAVLGGLFGTVCDDLNICR
jgi:hypothetical protein